MTVLVPMTPPEFAAFVDEAVPAYAADKMASGQWAAHEALALARRSLAELLPQGLASAGHHLFTVRDPATSTAVGVLWIGAETQAGKPIAYVYNVSIQPQHRRQGHASRALVALEDTVRDLGLQGVALHVFGHNGAAQALYAKLGYQPTDINLYKPVV